MVQWTLHDLGRAGVQAMSFDQLVAQLKQSLATMGIIRADFSIGEVAQLLAGMGVPFVPVQVCGDDRDLLEGSRMPLTV